MKDRIRRGPKDASSADVWASIQAVIRHPNATREVWIAMGQGLSYSAFEEERNKTTPVPEAIQLFYLLQSTWSAVSSVGALLRVFCMT